MNSIFNKQSPENNDQQQLTDNIENNSTAQSSEIIDQNQSSSINNDRQKIEDNDCDIEKIIENDNSNQIDYEKLDEKIDNFKNKYENSFYMNNVSKNNQEKNADSNKIDDLNSSVIMDSKLKLNIELGEFDVVKNTPFKVLFNKKVFPKDGSRISANEVSKKFETSIYRHAKLHNNILSGTNGKNCFFLGIFPKTRFIFLSYREKLIMKVLKIDENRTVVYEKIEKYEAIIIIYEDKRIDNNLSANITMKKYNFDNIVSEKFMFMVFSGFKEKNCWNFLRKKTNRKILIYYENENNNILQNKTNLNKKNNDSIYFPVKYLKQINDYSNRTQNIDSKKKKKIISEQNETNDLEQKQNNNYNVQNELINPKIDNIDIFSFNNLNQNNISFLFSAENDPNINLYQNNIDIDFIDNSYQSKNSYNKTSSLTY
jgi:hypothetical protein